MPFTCFFCILERGSRSFLIIIALVVHRKITAHSAELALSCGLTVILKMAGAIAQTLPGKSCTVKAFPWEHKIGNCHLILSVGNTLTDKEVEDWLKKKFYVHLRDWQANCTMNMTHEALWNHRHEQSSQGPWSLRRHRHTEWLIKHLVSAT